MAPLNRNMHSRALSPFEGVTGLPTVYRPPVTIEAQAFVKPEFAGMGDVLSSLLRGKWILAGFAAAGILGGILIALLQTPVYQAHTLIEIQGLNENFLNRRDMDPTVESALQMDTYLQTQIKILQTESLIGRVADGIKLLSWPDYQNRPSRLTNFAGRTGLTTRAAKPAAAVLREDAIQQAARHLTVRISGQTRIVEVLFEAGDPRLAANFANSLVDEYIAGSLANRVGATQQTGELLAGQLKDLKSEVENSEQRLQNYALRSGLVFISDKDNAAEAKLRQLQASLSVAQDARAAEQSKYEMSVNSPADSLPDVLDSQTLRSYQVNLTDLRRQAADLSAVLTPTHYKVQQLKAQIAELQSAADRERTNIQGRIKNQYRAAARRQTLIEDDYANQMRLAATQAAKSVRYDSLKREVDMHRLLYEATLQKVKEAGVASAIRANNVRVLDPANPPRVPIRPNRSMNAAMGMIAGTFFGLGFVLLRQRTERPIQIPNDARVRLQMPELGAIPSGAIALRHPFQQNPKFMPGRRSNGFGSAHSSALPGNRLELVTWQQRDSPLAESFRGTLASLLFSAKNGSAPRVIVITSASAGEGKTTVTTNLGIALAATNHRVLLIDGNRRNPRLHEIFGLSGSWGFSNLLQSFTPCDEYASEDLALETEIPGLCVLPSGSDSSSIPNLLYDRRTAELIARLRSEFDAILIDTPPVLTHADARALGRLADGAALVIRADQTPLELALAAWMRLNEDGVNGLGTIFNDCRAGARS